jgi:hypothetical protein
MHPSVAPLADALTYLETAIDTSICTGPNSPDFTVTATTISFGGHTFNTTQLAELLATLLIQHPEIQI